MLRQICFQEPLTNAVGYAAEVSTWRESTSNLDSLFFFFRPGHQVFWGCRCEELEVGFCLLRGSVITCGLKLPSYTSLYYRASLKFCHIHARVTLSAVIIINIPLQVVRPV